MNRQAILAALCLFLPAPLAGAQEITVIPAHPTVEDEVIVQVDFVRICAETFDPPRIEGNLIAINVRQPIRCPPAGNEPVTFEVELGKLPPANYRVEYTLEVQRDLGNTVQLLDEEEFFVTTQGRIRDVRLVPPRPVAGQDVTMVVDVEPVGGFIYRSLGDYDLPRFLGFVSPILDPPPLIPTFELPLGPLPAGEQTVLLEGEIPGVGVPGILDLAYTFEVADGSVLAVSDHFQVEASWNLHGRPDGTGGGTGIASAVTLTPRSGYFWFFEPGNVELVVKVLKGCEVNGYHWVFAAGMTNVGVDLMVEDLDTGFIRNYTNPVGTPFRPILDVKAFRCLAP